MHWLLLAEEAEEDEQPLIKAAYAFLHGQGVINFGILKDEPGIALGTSFLPVHLFTAWETLCQT